MPPLNGSCLCGNIKITVKDGGLPLKPVICRCTNCQQTAGAPYSLVAILPEEHVEITGEPKAYKDTTPDSGNHSSRRFCGECGSPIQTVATSRPSTAIIKMGMFAKSGAWGKEIDAPVAQVFTKNKKDWESLVEGAATMQDQTA
ncbi:hypothetical protein NDA18_003073 [Ustilago nuda]|nr:hypothetical protein NDA18_003073 [Ustilago nuda]